VRLFRRRLKIERKRAQDCIRILAGDLFHDHRPSRDALCCTITLLREHTLGDPLDGEWIATCRAAETGVVASSVELLLLVG
jgi:DNA repair exonuclease SbcCD nuclease subunit